MLKQKEEALQRSTAIWISQTGAADPQRALLDTARASVLQMPYGFRTEEAQLKKL